MSVASILVLVALGALTSSAVVVWREAHHDDARDIDRADAIVVLGAAQYDGTPSPVFQGRLDHAALLFEQGRAAVIFVLGANQPGDRTTEAQAGRDYLTGRGVPSTSVIALPAGHTSYTSLKAAARAMGDRELSSAFLVSDPWHNARIQRMAADLGIDGHASATWTSAARSEGTRLPGYVRETFAYLSYLVTGH
ncbi:MAG: YdcF family protein [Actinomycetota bacterium]|nr:YdcF family protein [Actinomycetota bacterium]MDH5313439.1 YdcF family protein [Actinomycetota bacterium]